MVVLVNSMRKTGNILRPKGSLYASPCACLDLNCNNNISISFLYKTIHVAYKELQVDTDELSDHCRSRWKIGPDKLQHKMASNLPHPS